MATLIGVNLTAATYATATNSGPILGGGKSFTVGATAENAGKEYMFVQSNSAVAAYDMVHIPSDTFVAAGLTTALSAASQALGVAQFALASGEYGWVQTYGACKLKVLGACAKDVKLYSTTTAGSLDDATASNYEIFGVQILSTNPSATATAMSAFISWPRAIIRPGVL
jgi:hypothetical protein